MFCVEHNYPLRRYKILTIIPSRFKSFYCSFTVYTIVCLVGCVICFAFMLYNFSTQPLPFRADGEKYFLIALNPFVKDPAVTYIRYLRILLPLLTFFLSELTLRFFFLLNLQLEKCFVTMVWIWILNIGFYLWTCKTSLKLFRNYTSLPFLSFGLLVLNPILLISVSIGLTDPIFYAFIFNLLCSIKENKNSVFPYSVLAALARFDYSLFILPFLAYESYRRRNFKLFLLIPLMIITTLSIFLFFSHIFEISVISIILNFSSNNFSIFPLVGWIIGFRNATFFSKIFVSVLFCIIIFFFITFVLDLLYYHHPQDIDVFSLCLMTPLLFAGNPLTISYTSGLGRMISACPSTFCLPDKIEIYTGFSWISQNNKPVLILFFIISFVMVYGYFV